MAKLVSKTYGQALFDLACEDNAAHQIQDEVLMLKQLLQEDKEILDFFNQPKISKEEKISFIESSFGGRVSKELLGFLVIIVTKGRYDELVSILDYYLEQMKEYDGIGVVSVTSAVSLSDKQVQRINDRLLAITKYKSLEILVNVDPGILGGLVIRIGDRVVDNSIKTKISSLQKDLMSISLT